MRRTQIQLTEQQTRRLRDIAADEGRSLSNVIRESVDLYISAGVREDRETLKARALAAAGKFRSSKKDIGSNHDRYLAEDFSD